MTSDWNCVGHMVGVLKANEKESKKKYRDFCQNLPLLSAFVADFLEKYRITYLRGDRSFFFTKHVLRKHSIVNGFLFPYNMSTTSGTYDIYVYV